MGYRRYLIEGVLSVENSTQLVDLDNIDVPKNTMLYRSWLPEGVCRAVNCASQIDSQRIIFKIDYRPMLELPVTTKLCST